MPLNDLTEEERRVVYACLECVAAGDVILHDWEFDLVMGLQVEEFLSVVAAWPNVDDSEKAVREAINGSFNNLLGYPHGFHDRWDTRMSVPLVEIARVYSKWRGRHISSYFDGIG
jgi:hypothetical protein